MFRIKQMMSEILNLILLMSIQHENPSHISKGKGNNWYYNLGSQNRSQYNFGHQIMEMDCWETAPSFGFHLHKMHCKLSMASTDSNHNQLQIFKHQFQRYQPNPLISLKSQLEIVSILYYLDIQKCCSPL